MLLITNCIIFLENNCIFFIPINLSYSVYKKIEIQLLKNE